VGISRHHDASGTVAFGAASFDIVATNHEPQAIAPPTRFGVSDPLPTVSVLPTRKTHFQSVVLKCFFFPNARPIQWTAVDLAFQGAAVRLTPYSEQ